MSCLHPFVALLPLAVFGATDESDTALHPEEPRQFITIERPGLPPVQLPASDELVARDALAGTWQVTSVEYEGRPRPDLAGNLQMRFSRGRLELLQRGRRPTVVAYDLDLRTYPPRFSWVLRRPGRTMQQAGVYWLDGDTLMLCVSSVNARGATEFLTQPGDGRTMFILQRVPIGDTMATVGKPAR